MKTFTGAQLAVAIEDLANDALLESEEILEKEIINELLHLFPISPSQLDRKLINGLMRGSTSIKKDQLVEGFERIQLKLRDDRDASELVNRVINNLDDERREIHLRRTQKSAVRQILRALNDDIDSVPTVREYNLVSFLATQSRLREKELGDFHEVEIWADSVVNLYTDLFVSESSNETLNTRKQRGIVTYGAAKSYISVWSRFIHAHLRQLIEMAPEAKIKPLKSAPSRLESNFAFNSAIHISNTPEDKVTIKISNSGQNKMNFSKTWSSKASARKGLDDFFEGVELVSTPNERLDLASLEIDDDEKSSYKLEEVTIDTIKNFFGKMLY